MFVDRNFTHSPFLVALVLAGGQSSRMGRDKALILWHGQPMLQRVCQVAADCCQLVYIFTSRPDRYQDQISGDYQWLMESNPGNGPLMALSQALDQIDTEWILLLACDLPELDRGILQQWSEQLSDLSPDILAVVPQSGDRWEPMCGFYRKTVQPTLEAFIQEGGRSFQGWFKQIPVQSIPVSQSESQMLKNCNTPEDLAQLWCQQDSQ
jgi:molybdopterin-guanine dinucleotide biosynthesis protein A